jgi:hypothetical protein
MAGIDSINGILEARPASSRRAEIKRWLLAAAILLLPLTALPQPSTAKAHEVKAAFLLKFTQYTIWPTNTFASDGAPVVIGVAGADLVYRQLQREAKGTTGARPAEIRQVTTLEEALGCHVLFIGDEENRQEEKWLAELKGKPILTVGESEEAIEHGAVMRFVTKNQTLRFEASLAASQRNRLELNERMLAVAIKVYKAPRPD